MIEREHQKFDSCWELHFTRSVISGMSANGCVIWWKSIMLWRCDICNIKNIYCHFAILKSSCEDRGWLFGAVLCERVLLIVFFYFGVDKVDVGNEMINMHSAMTFSVAVCKLVNYWSDVCAQNVWVLTDICKYAHAHMRVCGFVHVCTRVCVCEEEWERQKNLDFLNNKGVFTSWPCKISVLICSKKF